MSNSMSLALWLTADILLTASDLLGMSIINTFSYHHTLLFLDLCFVHHSHFRYLVACILCVAWCDTQGFWHDAVDRYGMACTVGVMCCRDVPSSMSVPTRMHLLLHDSATVCRFVARQCGFRVLYGWSVSCKCHWQCT